MSSGPLNYAPPPPHRRNAFRRWIGIAIVLPLLVLGWYWVPHATTRIKILYWQHRCLTFRAPSDRVVFDSLSPTRIPPPAEWARFYTLVSPPGFRDKGTIFLGEMKLPDGDPRLVAVDIVDSNSGPIPHVLEGRIFKPGIAFQPEQEIGDTESDSLPDERVAPFRIFTGVLDPADPNHFSFRTVQGAEERMYDGWLSANGNLNIAVRKNAATRK